MIISSSKDKNLTEYTFWDIGKRGGY